MTDTATPDVTPETSVHHRTCPLCEATCGLEITMRGDEVVRIRGDRDDVFSRGFICPKGSTLKQLHTDPDRLRQPLVRTGPPEDPASWRAVSWAEAFAEVERRFTAVVDAHGRDAVAVYLGNPNVHNLAGTLYNRALLQSLGTTNIYSASTVDQMPKHVSSGLLFGGADTIPVPDLDRTSFLLVLGANPWASNGSLCTAPDFPGRLKAIQARGGRFVVVDPRRTRTAAEADEHLAIRPGTDALLLAAMIQVLFAEDLVDLGVLAPHTDGVDAVGRAVAGFTPERVAGATGIDADVIRRLARELAGAPTAAVYGRIGTHTVRFGTVASWAVDVLNVLTGNLDRPGGAMFPLPAHARRPGPPAPGRGFRTGRRRSRVGGHPEIRQEYPVAALAEEIETPGEGQIRALFTVAGNPVLSTPDSDRLDAALEGLDLMVSVDPYRNETTRRAHVILPPPSPLTRSHYDLAFSGLSVRNVVNWSAPIVDTDQPSEHEILSRLALIAAGQGADADPDIVDGLLLDGVLARSGVEADPATLAEQLTAPPGPDRLVEAMVRAGPYGDRFGADPDGLTFTDLEANPHGIDLGPLQPRVPEILRTASGHIELAPDVVLDDLARLDEHLVEADAALAADDGGVVLIGRRHVRSNNSWMHNVDVLVKGKDRCTLMVHPDDADRLGLADGGSAIVRSSTGRVVTTVEVTVDIRPGVVSLPHGWGHDMAGAEMAVARAHAGVNTNVLTPAVIDPLSGNAALNAIPVEVTPA